MTERNYNLPTPAEAEALSQLGLFAAEYGSWYPENPSSLMEVLVQLNTFCVKAVEGLIRKFPDHSAFEARYPERPLQWFITAGVQTLPTWRRASAGTIPKIDQTTVRASVDIPKGDHFASADLSLCEEGHEKFTLRYHRGAEETSSLSLTEVDLGCGTAVAYLQSVQGLAILRDGECSLEPDTPGQPLDLTNLRSDERAIYNKYDEAGLVAVALMDGVRHLAEAANHSS